jgi:hypothetical protein
MAEEVVGTPVVEAILAAVDILPAVAIEADMPVTQAMAGIGADTPVTQAMAGIGADTPVTRAMAGIEADTPVTRAMAGIEADMAGAVVMADIEVDMAGAVVGAVGAGAASASGCILRRFPITTQRFGTPVYLTIMRTIITINGTATWVSMKP